MRAGIGALIGFMGGAYVPEQFALAGVSSLAIMVASLLAIGLYDALQPPPAAAPRRRVDSRPIT